MGDISEEPLSYMWLYAKKYPSGFTSHQEEINDIRNGLTHYNMMTCDLARKFLVLTEQFFDINAKAAIIVKEQKDLFDNAQVNMIDMDSVQLYIQSLRRVFELIRDHNVEYRILLEQLNGYKNALLLNKHSMDKSDPRKRKIIENDEKNMNEVDMKKTKQELEEEVEQIEVDDDSSDIEIDDDEASSDGEEADYEDNADE
ncbi:unnamed protein product [Caenorhabditis bovis]|uniref:Uncharacterized protein n=1 Tax=Caenorhabditis bovis TaxID=2654633 RepID=A0A8S1EL63_9PELO|nr:unnamed protein product [Caenorhabditis bovis]